MSSEQGGKEDGGKPHSTKGLARRAANILHGRSNADKEQPLSPQTTAAAGNGTLVDARAALRPTKPSRSQTMEPPPPPPPKHTNQVAVAQGATEHPPLLRSSSTAGAAPNHTAAQAATSAPPPLASAPVRASTPTSAPAPAPAPAAVPSVTPAKRPERPDRAERERSDRPGSVDPHVQRVRELEQQIQTLKGHYQDLKERNQHIEERNQHIEERNQYLEERNRDLEGRYRFYESDPYRQELLSIRTHLQVNDLLEPWEISQRFQAINKAVENASRNLSEFLADNHEPKTTYTATDFLAYAQMPLAERQHDPASSPVPIEDFIDFCCRALINQALTDTVFKPDYFNPALSDEKENQLLSNMYSGIRINESQIIAGRWRVSSFNARKDVAFPSQNTAVRLCQEGLGIICRDVYGTKAADQAANKIFPEVKAIFDQAWEWYKTAKSSIVLLDFQPFCLAPGSPFIPEHVTLEGRKPKQPASGAILLTSRLGLVSSEALGKGRRPTEIVQLKATALTVEYFSS